MKLERKTESEIEKFNIGEEKSFGVSNVGLIFEILRNKLYANKIESICREVCSNARDAHREAGIPERPIEIVFPNFNLGENLFTIRDFGPGISPDRIENIFINYAESTKRDSNVETGGFGLGAKSPFAYTNSFSIRTKIDGTSRLYSCFIDESKIGKIALINEKETEEENGTEILIPIKSGDAFKFIEGIRNSTKYWEPRPIIFNEEIKYHEDYDFFKGRFWKISRINDGRYRRRNEIKIVVDGIQYEMDTKQLTDKARQNVLLYILSGNLFLFFDTGEISFSASRENIELNSKTLENIEDAISNFVEDADKIVKNKINEAPNYKEALKTYNEYLSKIFIKNNKWNGMELWKTSTFLLKVSEFVRIATSDKISKTKAGHLKLNNENVIVINDLTPSPQKRHINKLAKKYKDVNRFYVISISKEKVDVINQKRHFDKLGAIFLSKELTFKERKSSSSRLIIFLV